MNAVTDIFLPLALAFIMFALGLGLTGSDFLRVLKQPRDFFVGAISQVILLPVVAFILVKILKMLFANVIGYLPPPILYFEGLQEHPLLLLLRDVPANNA